MVPEVREVLGRPKEARERLDCNTYAFYPLYCMNNNAGSVIV
jgi:hypothetical protein